MAEWADLVVDENRTFLEMLVPLTFDLSFPVLSTSIKAAGWRPKVLEVGEMVPHIADIVYGVNDDPETNRIRALRQFVSTPQVSQWSSRDIEHAGLLLHHAELPVFASGIAFLVLHFIPSNPSVTLRDWLSLTRAARFLSDKRRALRSAENETRRPIDVVNELLELDWGLTRGHVFAADRAYVYSATFVDGLTDSDAEDVMERLRRHVAADRELEAMPEKLDRQSTLVSNGSKRRKRARQWFSASFSHTAFLAHDLPASNVYYRDNLPKELRDQYQLLLLMSLQQRLGLIQLSRAVAVNYATKAGRERLERFDSLRGDMLRLTATGMFTQVMNRESFHDYYRHLQTVFEVPELYAEVRDEITGIYERLSFEIACEANELSAEETKRRATFEALVALVGVAFAVSSIAMGFFGINISGWTSGQGLSFPAALAIAGTTMVVGLGVGWAMSGFARRLAGRGPEAGWTWRRQRTPPRLLRSSSPSEGSVRPDRL